MPALRCGPQSRTSVHLVSSPTVTKVMARVLASEVAGQGGGDPSAQDSRSNVGVEDDSAHAMSACRVA